MVDTENQNKVLVKQVGTHAEYTYKATDSFKVETEISKFFFSPCPVISYETLELLNICVSFWQVMIKYCYCPSQ